MKICVVTGSRAEYGLLKNILKEIKSRNNLVLQLLVTGMHTSVKFGNTYKNILEDGFEITRKIDMDLKEDTAHSITSIMGTELMDLSKAFSELKPDVVLVLGDRYEILMVACATTIFNIPLVHLCGGDITEGAFDDNIRHAITKLAHVHLVSNDESGKRIIQMGENPKNVHVVGNPGLFDIMNFVETKNNFKFNTKNLLFVYHPVTTLTKQQNDIAILNILCAIENFLKDNTTNIFIIGSNSDTNNNDIMRYINSFVEKHNNISFMYTSLKRDSYLNLLSSCDMIVGNSSSGIYEAPLLKKPTVNIGTRQDGRLKGNTIFNCDIDVHSIIKAINNAYDFDMNNIIYPYPVNSNEKWIVDIIENINFQDICKKKFFSTI